MAKVAKWNVLDFETGGLEAKTSALCSVACAQVDEDFEEVARYYTIIKDGVGKFLSDEALRVNGIKREEIAHGTPWEDVFVAIKNMLEGCIPVAHNAQFDFRFLKERGYPIENAVCTMENDYKISPSTKHKLGMVYNRIFGHDFVGAHNSLDDVIATLQVLKWQVAQDPKYGEPQPINWTRFDRKW